MQFFFCEGCGKRITDAQVAAGEGRDKKLKGVYCSACAVGVTTMESLPLSRESARELLAIEEAQAEADSVRRVRRSSSVKAIPARKQSMLS